MDKRKKNFLMSALAMIIAGIILGPLYGWERVAWLVFGGLTGLGLGYNDSKNTHITEQADE